MILDGDGKDLDPDHVIRKKFSILLVIIVVTSTCVFLIANTETGLNSISKIFSFLEETAHFRGNIFSYYEMKGINRRFNSGEFFISDKEFQQLQSFIQRYPDSELTPNLKNIEAKLVLYRAENLAFQAEEANAIKGFAKNGSFVKILQRLKCKSDCTEIQKREALEFEKECLALNAKPFKGHCCDTICSEPIGRIDDIRASHGYLTVGEKANLQALVRISGLPKELYSKFVVELEKLDEKNRVVENLGKFFNTGQDGDHVANDDLLTSSFELNENKVGMIRLRAKYQRQDGKWYLGNILEIEVQPKGIFSNSKWDGQKNKILKHSKYGEIVASQILVVVRKGTSAIQVKMIADKLNCKILSRMAFIDGWVFETQKNSIEDLDRTMKLLRKTKEISSAEPNLIGRIN